MVFRKNLVVGFYGFVVFMLIACYQITAFRIANNNDATDFSSLYSSGQAFWNGKSLYTPVDWQQYHFSNLKIKQERISQLVKTKRSQNLNPPLLLSLMSPLAKLPFNQAFYLWQCLSLACLFIGSAFISHCFFKQFGYSPGKQLCLLLPFLGTSFAATTNLYSGQAGLFYFALAMAAWTLMQKQRCSLAAGLWGLLFACKLFFGLLLPFFLYKRQYRLFSIMLGGFIVCSSLPLLWLPLSEYHAYVSELTHVDWYHLPWNASIFGLLHRFNLSAHLIRAFASFMTLALLGIMFWIITPSTKQSRYHYNLDLSICLVIMLLISPLGWVYYFPLLFLPVLLLVYYPPKTTAWLLILLLCLFLLNYPYHNNVTEPLTASLNILSFYTFGLLMLLGLLIKQKYQRRFAKPTSLPLLVYILPLLPTMWLLIRISIHDF